MADNQTEIVLVHTIKQLQAAYDIRREVFLSDSTDTEEIEFDGNDLCSSHLLAYWKGKPAGTMRLRVVSGAQGGTIMWERLAILKWVSKENPWMFRSLLKGAVQYTKMMGIETVLGIVEDEKLMRFWKLYGCVTTGEEEVIHGEHAYTPLYLDLSDGTKYVRPSLKSAIRAMPEVFSGVRQVA